MALRREALGLAAGLFLPRFSAGVLRRRKSFCARKHWLARPRTPQLAWATEQWPKAPRCAWNKKTQNPSTASPLISGDKVYIINSAGVLNATNRADGERLWRVRLKGPFSGSPVASDNGHLYVFNEEGVGQCVDLSGAEGSVVSEIELGETIISTASISGDALYIRSDGSLWKIAGPPPSKGEAKSQSAP